MTNVMYCQDLVLNMSIGLQSVMKRPNEYSAFSMSNIVDNLNHLHHQVTGVAKVTS